MEIKSPNHTIAVVDDHLLFARSLEKLINSFPGFETIFHAKNGIDLQLKLNSGMPSPDIILLDIKMPVMDGIETAEWLTLNKPNIKVLALSMEDDEKVVLKMLSKGAKGYLLKDIHPQILKTALIELMENGYYHSAKVTAALLHVNGEKEEIEFVFKENELIFLQLACSEMTYKEIAEIMLLSPKTIDGYRQYLFTRLGIKNRVGLVIYALKHNLIHI